MYSQEKKSRENKSRAAANAVRQPKSVVKQEGGIVDNRSEMFKQQQMQRITKEPGNSNQVVQQTALGTGIGAVVGGAVGALGFLGGPILGGITTVAGAGIGGLVGNYLTRGNKRPTPKEVTIAENEVKTAEAVDTIKFPSVTSCMTITLILENGKKVGGHIGLYAGTANGVIGRMNAAREGVAVTRILAKGHGSIWGKNLENTEELRPKISQQFYEDNPQGDFDEIDYITFGEIQGALSVQQNQGEFRGWISGQFGGGNVVYQNTEDGDLHITAGGQFA